MPAYMHIIKQQLTREYIKQPQPTNAQISNRPNNRPIHEYVKTQNNQSKTIKNGTQ